MSQRKVSIENYLYKTDTSIRRTLLLVPREEVSLYKQNCWYMFVGLHRCLHCVSIFIDFDYDFTATLYFQSVWAHMQSESFNVKMIITVVEKHGTQLVIIRFVIRYQKSWCFSDI